MNTLSQNMVTFYGAGQRTGAMNVEKKLSKVLGKADDILVLSAGERDTVLDEISAFAARYDRFDPETANGLRKLRSQVKDLFNKGLPPGDDLMDELYFLTPQTRDLVEKLSLTYDKVVTPDDFASVASIMSEHLAEQVPILKDFTRFFGRLAEDYLNNAKPGNADFDWTSIAKGQIRGSRSRGYVLPDDVSEFLGVKRGQPVSEKMLQRLGVWNPNSSLADLLLGVNDPTNRRIGGKYFKYDVRTPTLSPSDWAKGKVLQDNNLISIELFKANKLPKSWTNVPWVNFDGKTIEQNFTQKFEERLTYRNPDGTWSINILQIPQRTSSSWWDELANASGKFNDIADTQKARTAFAVNGNHSNDAVIVKKFHLWGRANKVPTSTIHDAFFTNSARMLEARKALREIYAESLDKNVIKMTLDEMRARGLPKDLYNKYMEEAVELGLIPIPGKSRIGGRLVKESDILRVEDILRDLPDDFKSDYGWYGVN